MKQLNNETIKRVFRQVKDQAHGVSGALKKFPPLFFSFSHFFFLYLQKKVITASVFFETQKNILVKFFIMKRGRYNRPFLHVAAMGVVILGVFVAPFLAERYPVFSSVTDAGKITIAKAQEQPITVDSDVFQTDISQKPRDKVISYSVQKGDTLSTIAEKFQISTDTIRWENDLTNDSLAVGDELKISPVTGIVHKVEKGETVYSIAKKYDTNPQAIVDFPFNDFANPQTFTLVAGQTLVVPDGVKPQEAPVFRRQIYIAQGPVTITASGFTWPLRGAISQFAAWYHMAIDITSPVGTPIVAGQNGKVVKALVGAWDGGYGTNVAIDNGNGWGSLYAHMSALNVGVGDDVVAGKTVIGWVGLTGRTTGAHLHFEIRRNGILVNPLSYLQ